LFLTGDIHRDRDVAFLVTLLDIAMCLDDLLEWVDPVNDRFDYTRFDQFLENQPGLTQKLAKVT
jgi:hypothetical protein